MSFNYQIQLRKVEQLLPNTISKTIKFSVLKILKILL